jgi:hypothetical protein
MQDAKAPSEAQEVQYEVTEEDFHKAVNKAGPYARQRLAHKMEKKNKKTGMPPKDLERWVKNWVLAHKSKQ